MQTVSLFWTTIWASLGLWTETDKHRDAASEFLKLFEPSKKRNTDTLDALYYLRILSRNKRPVY